MFNDSKNIQKTSEIRSIDGDEQSHQKIGMTIDEFDEQFWLKKFRRALMGDQDTQRRLQQKFSPLVIDLIRNHPLSVLALGLQNQEFFVPGTFRCFWSTAHGYQKYSLNSLSDVLSSLSMSVNTVILDAIRGFSSFQENPSAGRTIKGEMLSRGNVPSREIWGLIEDEISNERERRIAFLVFQCALKPHEIVESFPNEFSDANEISHIRLTIMELLNDGNLIASL